MKITAPSPTTGEHSFGPVTLSFTDGVAEVAELPPMVRAYMEGRGYTVTTQRKRKPKEVAEDATGSQES
ncbi:MAG: hypothetical protein L0K12_16040 [Brevibacterium aurantiacum]|nr:hypothetical protein [Brevibacterium aurantiacum]